MLWHTRRCDISIQCLRQTVNHLSSLTGCKGRWWAGGQDEVAIQVDDQSVIGSCEKRSAFSCDTQYIWTRFLNELICVSCVDYGNIKTAPFIDTNAVTDGF